jgi:AcrR family transcriptional regulator
VTQQRHKPADRTRELLDTALHVAAADGWANLTRDAIAVAAGVSPALVSARLGTMAATKRAVMREAVRREVLPVVAEGLALRDAHAMRASDELKGRVAAWLAR